MDIKLNPDIISRFSRLERSLKKLDKIVKTTTKEKFLKDDDVQDITERNLHIAIEALIDISNHLISRKGFRKPESNVEIFDILLEGSFITKELAGKMKKWVRFRNILVHDYADIDSAKVYEALAELDDLRDVAKILAEKL